MPTGLVSCYDMDGAGVACDGTGQDADRPLSVLPEPRFVVTSDGPVRDQRTGLLWYPSANVFVFPLSFAESIQAVQELNQAQALGRTDWRLPTRQELRSLVSHGAKNPALPSGHPFADVFLGRYWTSTPFAGLPGHAWYVHLEGARVFYERTDRYCLAWPVAGTTSLLPDIRWPEPRFVPGQTKGSVMDVLTGLSWLAQPLPTGPMHWGQALKAVAELARQSKKNWRLSDINELESVTDVRQAYPALSEGHPFGIRGRGDGYWSSTSSFFDPAWAYVLYLDKGAVGVGFKPKPEFFAWPVLR
ncbi:hypothetical protein MASR1M90_16240 [Desulfovibrionales bacterium]